MACQPTHLDKTPTPSSESTHAMATETMASLPIPAALQEKPLPPSNTPTLFSSDPDSDLDPEKLPGNPSDSDSDPEKSLQPPSSSSPVDVHPSRSSPLKWTLILLALYISAFLYGLDTTIAADIQGPVISTFPLDGASKFSWIGFGFPLGSVAVILLVSKLYSSFNMKWLYILSILLFEVGSVICGAAPNMDALIVGRVLTGMGGSGIYLGVLNYITLLTGDTERGFYISLTGFSWGVGAVLGPVIGGSFAESERTTWRWAFYINLVVGAAVAPVYFWCLPGLNLGRGKNLVERVRAFDWLGLGLFAAVWATFTVGFSSAGVRWAWSDASSIALVVVFGVVLLALVGQQYFAIGTTKETRAFPGHLLKSRTQVSLYVATAATSSALFVVTYYIPIYFQFVHSDSPINAAVRLLPFIIVNVTCNVLSGRLLSTVRYYMPIFLVGGALVTIGSSLLMVKLDAATGAGTIYGLSIIIAIGSGLTIQLGYAVATLTVKPADIGNALSMQNVSQIGSSAIALVIAGQIFQSVAIKNLEAALGGHGYSSEQIATAVTGAQSEIFQLLSGDLRATAVDAIVGAMQKSFVLVIVAGAALFVSAALMKRERLFGEVVVA